MSLVRDLCRRTFALPAIIGALSLFGLLAALLGDGLVHAVAWAALSAPLVAAGWGYRRTGQSGTARRR